MYLIFNEGQLIGYTYVELEEQYLNWLDGKTPALDECWGIQVDDLESYRYALQELN